jgi:peptidoglycan/xylan/chitin deacetylase (PgdA/CDA1 family)
VWKEGGVVRGASFFAVVLWLCAVHATEGDRTVAVTFDDLPATAAFANDLSGLTRLTRNLVASVREHRVPAVGFVNEGKLFEGGSATVEARSRLLETWLDAGLELGNHTYSHGDLNRTPLEDFQADVVRGEVVTRRLMEGRGRRLRYFRHPFLHVGEELSKRRAFESFLERRGYVVAPVTIDNDEFVFAAAYDAALRRRDAVGAAKIADEYLRYMEQVVSFFEDVSRRVTGREIPQVLLLHANHLNADRFARFAGMLVGRGYRFVSLEEALEDPAYRRPDDFVGAPGNSWFSHWEISAGRKAVPTPAPPGWVSGYGRQ